MGHFPSWAEGTLIEYNQCHQSANETQSGGAIRDILQRKMPDSCRKLSKFLEERKLERVLRQKDGGGKGNQQSRLSHPTLPWSQKWEGWVRVLLLSPLLYISMFIAVHSHFPPPAGPRQQDLSASHLRQAELKPLTRAPAHNCQAHYELQSSLIP